MHEGPNWDIGAGIDSVHSLRRYIYALLRATLQSCRTSLTMLSQQQATIALTQEVAADVYVACVGCTWTCSPGEPAPCRGCGPDISCRESQMRAAQIIQPWQGEVIQPFGGETRWLNMLQDSMRGFRDSIYADRTLAMKAPQDAVGCWGS